MPSPLIVRCRPLLELARERQSQDTQAVHALLAEAKVAREQSPLSVTDKRRLPPSGDPRDYMSQGPYWWPNPGTADGLPYVRRDGEFNPETLDSDRTKLVAMAEAVDTLALAWFFTGEPGYAESAAEMLRVFFLDEHRGMRPHLNYGQAIPGLCDGRGIGIIETWIFAEPLLDAILLLEDAPGLTGDERAGLRQWFSEYLQWLLTSPHGQDEAKEHNNHGTAYDLQVCALAAYLGRLDLARDTLGDVPVGRIIPHIEPDGSQPHELARTRALSYSTFNLRMLTALAEMGPIFGVDLWGFELNGCSLRAAVDWLVPYWTQAKPFTHQQIVPFEPAQAEWVLRRAAHALGEPAYEHAANQLPAAKDFASALRCRLLYPPLNL